MVLFALSVRGLPITCRIPPMTSPRRFVQHATGLVPRHAPGQGRLRCGQRHLWVEPYQPYFRPAASPHVGHRPTSLGPAQARLVRRPPCRAWLTPRVVPPFVGRSLRHGRHRRLPAGFTTRPFIGVVGWLGGSLVRQTAPTFPAGLRGSVQAPRSPPVRGRGAPRPHCHRSGLPTNLRAYLLPVGLPTCRVSRCEESP